MNRYLLIISFVLISLLAVGAVSASDAYNSTDVSVMSVADEDIGGVAVDDGLNDLEEISQVENLEKGEDESIVSAELNNQSTDVLSEDNSNSTDSKVAVEDTTLECEDNSDFQVLESEDSSISGGVIVGAIGENDSMANYVGLENGQAIFKIIELLEVLGIKDMDTIADIIFSSFNFNNTNVSKIFLGLGEIVSGFAVNISNVSEGLDEIRNGTYLNVSEFKDGLALIKEGVYINISAIKEGIIDIIGGIHINVSNIIENIVPEKDFNFTQWWDDLKVHLDELRLELSDLFIISFNQSLFDEALKDIYNELNITDEVLNKIDDLMVRLNFTSELKDNISNILDGNVSLAKISQVFKDILASNLTLQNIIYAFGNVTDGFNFNASDLFSDIFDFVFNSSNVTNAFGKIIDAFNNTHINASKIVDKIINSTKISNMFEGLMEIFQGIKFNMSNFTLGIKDISSMVSFNFSNVSKIIEAINFTSISDVFGGILKELNITKSDILDKVKGFFNYLDLDSTDEFQDFMWDIIKGNPLNFTKAVIAVKSMIDYNNLTFMDILSGLDNVTGGCIFNVSKLADKIIHSNVNFSNIAKLLKSVKLNFTGIVTGLLDCIDLNTSAIYDKISEAVSINMSAINDGFDKIAQEIGFNASKIIDTINDVISINGSAIIEGITKIIGAFHINVSSIHDGMFKVADAFKFNISSIVGGLSKIIHSFGYNVSSLMNGIGDIAEGAGFDVQEALTKSLSLKILPGIDIFESKLPTQIVASDVSTDYGNSKIVIVALKDVFGRVIVGKEVTVQLDGKTYNGVTNAMGQVTIDVPKNLVPKTYAAHINFAGDDNYAKSTKSIKVVVSKLTPKIIAKKKTFRSSLKNKKFAITLKTNKNKAMKNKKVTLKVNGKTYKAKTNKKGKATFKITKLTKIGTYKTAIKYNGDAIYNKVTKNLKIKVK